MQRWGTAALIVWTMLGTLITLILLSRILAPLRPLLLIVFLALIIVVLLVPIVDVLHKRRVPRLLGAVVAYLVATVVVALVIRSIVPVVRNQFAEIAAAFPDLLAQAEPTVRRLADLVGIEFEFDPNNIAALFEDARVTEFLMNSLGGFAGLAGSFVTWIFLLFLAPVIAFYVLVDLPRIHDGLMKFIPRRKRDQFQAFLSDAAGSFGGFIRGQFVVAAFVGLFTGLALWIIGVPFAAVIGLVAGITDIIPFVGPFIGGALAVAVALTTDGVGKAIAAAVAVLIVQQLESHAISPLVLGKAVELRPLAVLVAVIVGGTLAGLPGLLIAIPLITVIRAVFRHTGLDGTDPESESQGDPPEDESSGERSPAGSHEM
jgi:predicted PurR-regulated permease PerM